MTEEEQVEFWVEYNLIISHPGQRRGQARMNALGRVRPDLYDMVSGTTADCFYRDEYISNFEAALGLR